MEELEAVELRAISVKTAYTTQQQYIFCATLVTLRDAQENCICNKDPVASGMWIYNN